MDMNDLKGQMINAIKRLKRPDINVIGVDISDGFIKLAHVYSSEDHSSRIYVDGAMIYRLPYGIIQDDSIIDDESLSVHLRRAIDQFGLRINDICMGLHSNQVIIKKITIPAMTQFELVKQIKFEIDDIIPYDIDDVYVDFDIIGTNSDELDKMDVLIIACKKDIANTYRQIAKKAGLTLKYLDCESFALENATAALGIADEPSATAIFDIGYNTTSISVLIDSQPLYSKTIVFGTKLLESMICDHYEIKATGGHKVIEGYMEKIEDDLVDRFADMLADALLKLIDFYMASGFMDVPIKRVIFAGGGAMIQRVQPLVAESGVFPGDVTVYNINTQNLYTGTDAELQGFIDTNIAMLLVPIGLSLRNMDNRS